MPRSTRILLCTCCFLSAIIYLEIKYFDDSPSSQHQYGDTNRTEKMHYGVELSRQNASFQMPDIGEFSEVTDRPLFTSSRRQAPVAHALEHYQLRGTVLSSNHNIALVARMTDNAVLRVLEGDLVGSWQVITIGNDTLVLSNGEESHIMTMVEMPNENVFSNENEDRRAMDVVDVMEDVPLEDYINILSDRYENYDQINQQSAEIDSIVDAVGRGLDQWPGLPGELVLPPPPRVRLRPDRMFRDATRG